MYNGSKIIPGLVIFAVLLTFPVWYSIAKGKANYVPKPEITTTETKCIEPTEYMSQYHMDLLADWRLQVTRNNQTTYTASDGQTYEMSMENTCFKCHTNAQQFCDSCHSYTGVTLNCWSCHVEPTGK